MVNSIGNNGAPISTLLSAQTAGAPAVNAANGQVPSQTLIARNNNGAPPTTVTPSFKAQGSTKGGPLPRGSIVDVLA